MKKIIIITILLLSIVSITHAGPFVKFEAGPSLNVKNVYFTEAIIGYSFKFWEIESQTYGGWLTWAEFKNGGNNPFMDIYSINQKFIYNKWFIRFQHYCAHMVENPKTIKTHNDKNGNYMFTSYKPTPYWWPGSNRTISIGFEYKFK